MRGVLNLNAETLRLAGRQIWVLDPDGNVIELQQRVD
jgi:hypothetical protein